MALHFYSPRAYEFLRDKFNKNIPHPGTMRAWYANCNVNWQPGVTSQCLDMITERVDQFRRNNKTLVVTISFDEVNECKLSRETECFLYN